jgi:glycosyltransferase involved in cell wall biosynthesis
MEIQWPIRFYVPVLSRSLNGLLYLLSILPSSILLRRKFKYDVIYSVSAYPDGFASALLGKILNKPVIIRINGSDMNTCTRFYLQRMMIRWTLRNCKRIIAASADLKRKAVELEVPMERVDVIYNGVDPAVFFPEPKRDDPSKRKTILYVGNLKREKGVGELVEAFGLLRNGDAELVIIGEGPFRPQLESRIQDLGVQAKVKMLGYLLHDQVSKWLRRADILCLPSHNEGLPNVILEAFSSCVPVVATEVGGIPELIVSEEFGMMVPPGDSRALAQSLQLAMAKDWDYQKIKTYAGRFSWEHSAEKLGPKSLR